MVRWEERNLAAIELEPTSNQTPLLGKNAKGVIMISTRARKPPEPKGHTFPLPLQFWISANHPGLGKWDGYIGSVRNERKGRVGECQPLKTSNNIRSLSPQKDQIFSLSSNQSSD